MKKFLLIAVIVCLSVITGCQQVSKVADDIWISTSLGHRIEMKKLREKEIDRLAAYYAPLYAEAEEQGDTDRCVEIMAAFNKQIMVIEGRSLDNIDSGLKVDAYGPGIHMNQYGQPVTLRPDFGGVPGESLQIKPNAYGPGVHMDQYGRPVREYPWP